MNLKIAGGKFLTEKEYEKIGFKCGLEVHQQLDTKKKLFCNCPVGLVYAEPDAKILRHMRPTLSELGEYDGTALMEFKTKKEVIYHLYRDNTCTYEMDDTPPFPINQEAIDIAIEISLLFNCSIVDEVHIVRKQYLDGSIPTGFQRTAVIGLDGWIPYKDRKIGIRMITLEEDACREVSDIGHTITFSTDRLSTPLVEVITEPEILTPHEAEEVNWLIGEVLRSTGKVKRGFGSVRQDVNVSITGGTRVEIKGVPKIGYHAALTHNEALRQQKMIEIKDELDKAGIKKREDFNFERHNISNTYDWEKIIPNLKTKDFVVKGLKVKGINDIINYELQPDWVFSDELAGRVRVVACLDQMPNIVHSTAEKGNFVPVEVWAELRRKQKLETDELLIIVWGSEQDTDTALTEMEDRIAYLLTPVPDETRQSLDNGVTDFERVLPGPDRMYPDTDSSPTKITQERIENIRKELPISPFEVRKFSQENDINEETIDYILRSGLGTVFYDISSKDCLKPTAVAHFLKLRIAQLKREKLDVHQNDYSWVKEFFKEWKNHKFEYGELALNALRSFLKDDSIDMKTAFDEVFKSIISTDELKKTIEEIKKADNYPSSEDRNKKVRYVFNQLNIKYSMPLSSSVVAKTIKELV